MKGFIWGIMRLTACITLLGAFQGFSQVEYKLAPAVGYNWQDFGLAVSIDGDDALIGACPPWDYSNWPGSAFIYHWNGTAWEEKQKLLAPDFKNKDEFGERVALKNGRAVIGAKRQNGTGAAYVFEKENDTWVAKAKLVPNDPGARIMCAVAVDGDYVVAGDHWNYVNGIRSGAAYVFHYDGTNWQQQAKLEPTEPRPGGELGYSVALSGNRAVVGGSGDVYVYRRDGTQWTCETKITSPEPTSRPHFGTTVAIENNVIVIGDPELANPLSEMGAVYVYSLIDNNWTFQTRIISELSDYGQLYGYWISLRNKRLLVGAHHRFLNSPGAAYLYRQTENGWELERKFVPSDGHTGDFFGGSVSTDGKNALISAYRNSEYGTWSGVAYIYPLAPLNEPPVAVIDEIPKQEGTSPRGAWVTLHGEHSFDPEHQLLTYAWTAPEGISFDDPHSATPSAWFPYEITRVQLIVNDGELNSEPAEVDVHVTDTTPPTVTVTVTPDVLWPPNHKMVDITASVTASDNRDPNPAIVLLSITSSEPDDAVGDGDGNTINDIQGADFGTNDITFQVRAERDGNQLGRTYTVVYQATDQPTGLTSIGQTTIFVPHDKAQLEKQVAAADQAVPIEFALQQNYPNPFNPTTQISFQVPSSQFVLLNIYNSQGQLVRTLINETMNPGTHSVSWNGLDHSGRQVAAGLYVYTIRAGEFSATRKMAYIR